MKQKKKLISNYLLTIYVMALSSYILISDILILYKKYKLSELAIGLKYFCIAGIIIYIVNKILNKIKFDIYDIIIIILIALGIISTIYAVDPQTALNGFVGRYEGLFQIILYYVLFLNCKNISNDKCKKILVLLIITLGIIQAIYGILQFGDIDRIGSFNIIRKRFYSTGLEVNPNFFGTMMIISLSLSLTIYFINNNKYINILTLIESIILFLGLLCSGAMSASFALTFYFLFLIIIFFIIKADLKKTLIKILLIIPCFLLDYLIFNNFDNGYYLSQIEKNSYEIGETIIGNAKEEYGTGRIHIWKETLKIVPDNLLNGVGIDNFYYAFGNTPVIDIKSRRYVDKAHNEYLQKLITEGIFSLLSYLILLILIFISSIYKIFKEREKTNYLKLTLLLSSISYCIQAFFNISVISVAPFFYIITGLLCSYICEGKNEKVKC